MAFHVKDSVQLPQGVRKEDNGQIDDSLLVTVKDPNPVRGFDMTFHKTAARAWVAMMQAAREAGHDLFPTDKGFATYRDLRMQEAGFKFHYTRDELPGRPFKFWKNDKWFLRPKMEEAATPGTSNHGLGLAIDVANLSTSPRPSDTRSIWVLDNYQRFGFSHEFHSGADPCHIRYTEGDNVPDAVLGVTEVHDAGGRGAVQIKEDEMLPIITNLEPTRGVDAQVVKFVLMDDGRLRVLEEDEWILRGSLAGTGWTNEQISRRQVIG